MKPKAIRWFETLLITALVIDIGNNLLSSTQMSAGLAERGMAVSSLALILLSLLPAIVGFGFWYFIVHRRSSPARWLLLLLVAGSSAFFLSQTVRHGFAALSPSLIVAGGTEFLKLGAALCLFLPGTAQWFTRRNGKS